MTVITLRTGPPIEGHLDTYASTRLTVANGTRMGQEILLGRDVEMRDVDRLVAMTERGKRGISG